MEALELLGSRYIKPEQLAVGPVETLRAQNAATWRVVFIHRVSTTQEAAEQANLLKLLTTALVRSSEAKRLVLDFGEEQGFWNVVTESEPQCESLRDWLQAEVDSAEKGEAILSAEQAAAMGEFARLFARGVKMPPRKAVPAKAPKASGLPVPPPAEKKEPEVVTAAAETESAPAAAAHPAAEPAPLVSPVPPPQPPLVRAEEPKEPESPAPPAEEQPIVVPAEIPVIVISAPAVGKAMAATQSTAESNPPLGDAVVPPRTPLPPRSFAPRPPPLVVPPVAPPRSEPLIPEIVTELPKAVADPPKVVPIDARPQQPKAEAPPAQSDSRAKPVVRDDAPLFANSMPKPAKLSKMAVFFIILGVAALLLVLVIVYLSVKT